MSRGRNLTAEQKQRVCDLYDADPSLTMRQIAAKVGLTHWSIAKVLDQRGSRAKATAHGAWAADDGDVECDPGKLIRALMPLPPPVECAAPLGVPVTIRREIAL
jgi:hypothetical protein